MNLIEPYISIKLYYEEHVAAFSVDAFCTVNKRNLLATKYENSFHHIQCQLTQLMIFTLHNLVKDVLMKCLDH